MLSTFFISEFKIILLLFSVHKVKKTKLPCFCLILKKQQLVSAKSKSCDAGKKNRSLADTRDRQTFTKSAYYGYIL